VRTIYGRIKKMKYGLRVGGKEGLKKVVAFSEFSVIVSI